MFLVLLWSLLFSSECEFFYFNAAVRVGCGEVNSQVILFDKGLLQFVSIECAFTLWYPQKRETVKRQNGFTVLPFYPGKGAPDP